MEFHISEPHQYSDKSRLNARRVIVFVETDDRPGPFGNGNGTIKDEFVWRRTHTSPLPAKKVLELVRPLLEKRGIVPITAMYSRKAGCSMCPCSPGYIVRTEPYHNGILAIHCTEKSIIKRRDETARRVKETEKYQEQVQSAFKGEL